ncbi:MAG: hypothetical protein C0606_11940 [Hyphomicrobiales bacterium]|nr:MAG: hypothetical protein C0606_11940 [Hyphomicrobiales bacterium]
MAKTVSARSNRSFIGLVFIACVAVVALFAVSNLSVLRTAGLIAEDIRSTVEDDLVRNEIDRQIELLANDQSQISYWDETVNALGTRVRSDFVDEEIADWLWDDFRIHTTIIVGPDRAPRVTVFKNQRMAADAGREFVTANADMIEAATTRYMAQRKPKGSGFIIVEHPVRSKHPLYVAEIRKLHDEIGVIVVQAIVPDDEAVLADGNPHLLLTFKPLTATFATIGDKLGLADFRLEPAAGVAAERATHPIASTVSNTSDFVATWQPASPATAIWQRTLPYLAIAFGIVALALTLIVVRYARMFRALQKSEQENRFLALHDALTGLPNRLQFDRALESIVVAGCQDRCAILCMDLDRFKAVNDTYGHQAGDTVIRTVAERVVKAVGKTGLSARIGGDEFIILLRDRLDRDSVLWLCDTLIESVCAPIHFEGGTAHIGASIGVAWWPDDAMTAKTVIRSADEALYRAKEEGRGCARLAAEMPDEVPGGEEAAATA